MVAKLAIFSCLVAAAAAVAVPIQPIAKLAYAPAPIQYAPAQVQYAAPLAKIAYEDPEGPAQYDFEYSVHDNQSGDIKQQKESRSGDVVQGSYSLVQPDGVHRIVDYSSDKVNGFNAVVRYEGQPIEAPHVAKVLAAPVAKIAYAPAPIQYAPAPVAKVAYAPAPIQYAPAPVAKIAYAPAPVQYAPAPVAKIAYAPAPVQYQPAPIQYQPAPVHYAQAPIAKLSYEPAPLAKLAYSSNLGHVSFSSPAVSYQH